MSAVRIQTAEGISTVMQSLGRRYVQYINKRYHRCGTLWESRHKASVVDTDNYLLACYRYIELNPVTASMVEHSGDYRWSSYRWHAYGEPNQTVRDHSLYQALSTVTEKRRAAYRGLFDAVLTERLVDEITAAACFSMPLGNQRFKLQVEKALGRSVGYMA